MSEEKKSMLAAGTAYSIFGLSYLFSKMALNVTEPMILLCVRFFVTFVVLNLLVIFRVMKLDLKGKKLMGPIAVGILQPVLYFILENYGLKYTTTSFTGIISSICPVITALLGVLILREMPNFKQWICILLSIVGVAMVSVGSTGGVNTVGGCICLLAAYFIGSFYSIMVRKLSKDFSAFELTYVMFSIGFLFFAVLAFIQYRNETLPMIVQAVSRGEFVIASLYLGAASSVGAYMLANYSLARLPVTRSTIFTCFSTIVSVLSGVILMGDPFTPVSGLSFALILTGVFGVNYFAKQSA